MGGNHSKHHPHGPCGACIQSISSTNPVEVTAAFATLATAVSPLRLCDTLGGTVTTPDFCAKSDLCATFGGELKGGACVIKITDTPGATATVDEQKTACDAVAGLWTGECVVNLAY